MRYLASVRAAYAVAAACLFPLAVQEQGAETVHKALVYCPVGIDAVGCTNISAALAEKYPGGVDLGYDGTSGTVDLKTVNLWQYEVVVIPSLADNTGAQPYALLRDAVVAERLRDALMGRIAMWSGTPDLGTATSPNRAQKDVLIGNLAGWASGNYATVKGPGLVTFLDQSETATARYDWVQALTRVNVIADLKLATYASVSALTVTGTSILTNGDALLAYTNMASFGFQLPSGAAGVSLDAIGQTGTAVGGQVVLLTSAGGNSGGAIVRTDLDDYAPGTTVVMTGTGWQPGETVSLTLHEDPLIDADRTFTTVADASGNIEFTGFAPEQHNIDVRFILTAVGGSSGLRAQTTFTDGVTFAGSTTADNGAGGTSLMVGRPTSVAAGDLLLAQITFSGGNTVATLTAPADWTALPRDNSGSALGQVVYWKIAKGSEPASYTWGFSVSSKATGGIIRYSAVDIDGNANPIAASGSASGTQASGVTTALVAPSVATTTASTMVVTFFGIRADASLSTPAAMTERHQRRNINLAAPPGPSILASDAARFGTGETGTSTSTASDRGSWVAHTIAIDWRQTATGTGNGNVKVNRPADATAGDLLLANIVFRGAATVPVTVPEGWFLVAKRTNNGTTVPATTPLTQATYRHVVGSAEPADYTWSFAGGGRAIGGITAFTGIDTDNPIDAVATSPATDQAVAASPTPTAPSVTTTVPGTVIAALYAVEGGATATITTPAGMGFRYELGTNGVIRAAAADVLQNAVGASGDKVATTGVAARWVAQTIALRRRPVPMKLVFLTAAQSGLVNACLGPITVQTQDEYDRPTNVATNLTVNVASSGNGEFYTAGGCTTPPASSTTIASGTNSTSVWYKPIVRGTGAHELSVAASGMAGASQVQTVSGGPVGVPPATVTGILVQSTATSAFVPPSPDPSGLAYAAHLNKLVLVDGEVDEMPIYAGANVFETTPSGGLTRSWASTSFSHEPVGATYNPANRHLFLSDDDARKIFEIDPGVDGQYSTADDQVTSFDTHGYGSDDPEGLAFDAAQGVLFIADGVNSRVYRVSPGPNGVFDAVAPAGDDQVTSFDTERHGLFDPEGIAYDSDLGHLYVVGTPKTRVFELSTTGALINIIDISAAATHQPAGVEYVPATSSSSARMLYIVDRGFDNDSDPSENDGKMFQFALPSASGNYLPAVTVTAPANGAAYNQGSTITFTGTASDVESGNLTAALTWSSSRDGTLGSGGSVSTSGLSAGTHTITASVTDGNGGQASATIEVTVNSVVIPTTVGSISASSSIYGGTTNLSAAVSPAVAGSVAFFLGGSATPIVASYNAVTGVASVSGHAHGLGASASAYAVRAAFTPADGNYQGSEATNAAALDVAQASQTIGFDLGGVTAKYGDAPFTVAALASGGASGNAVTFAGETPGTCSVTSAGQVTIAATGLCTITASQAGNTNYSAASPVSRSFTVSARALTVTATGIDKVYDGTTAASVTLADDRIAGDALTTAYTGATFTDKNVGTSKTISVNGITLSGADAANYTVNATATATADIGARSLAVTAAGIHKEYDGTTAATVTLADDRVAGDVFAAAYGNATFADKNAGLAKAVTVTGIAISGTDAGNYDANTTASTSADIDHRPLTVSATGVDKDYDGTVAATVTLAENHLAGDVLSPSYASASFANPSAGTGKAVTVSGISLSGADAGNYTFNTTASTTATISKRLIGVTADARNKVYGDPDPELTYQVTSGSLVAGESFTGALARVAGATVAGSPYAIQQGTLSAGANYELGFTGANLTITRRSVSATIVADNKMYDGNATATITGTTAVDAIAEDEVGISVGAASFSDRNVGNDKVVTATGLTLGGAQADNYTLSSTTAVTTADIIARSLTITASAQNKIYDGNTTASVTLADNRISGDALTTTFATASFANKDIGTAKPVTVSGISLGGADQGNYTFNTTATATANITTRSVTGAITAENKIFDGGTAAIANGQALTDLLAGDAVTLSVSNARFDNRNVGARTVTADISLAGMAAGNYTLSAPTASASANIEAKALTGSFTAVSRAYDGTTAATLATTSLPGVVSPDAVSLEVTSAAFDNKHVGTAKTVTASLALAGAGAGNYTVNATATSTANVTARPLVVTATGIEKTYDGTTVATATLADDRLTGDVLTTAYSTASFTDKAVGTAKPVTVSGISVAGADAGNYTFNPSAATTANITARPLTVSATGVDKEYDGTVAATVTLAENHLAGDVLSPSYASASFANPSAGTGKAVTVSGISLSGADAGNYTFNTTASTTASIRAKGLTGAISAADKVYDGGTTAVATGQPLSGLLAGDAVTLSLNNAHFDSRSVGPRTVTADISLAGMAAGNYTLSAPTASASASITPKGLSGSFTAASRAYDGTTAATVATTLLPGVVSPDAVTLEVSNAAFDSKHVGTAKPVTASLALTGAGAGNYMVNATATSTANITARPLVVSAVGIDKVYDGTATASATLADNRIAGDALTTGFAAASFANESVGTAKTVTVSGISLGGPDQSNYSFNTTATTTANITPRPLTISATAANKVYDGTTAASVTLSDNRVSGDALTATHATASFADPNVGTGKAVSVSGIAISGADALNYTFNTTALTTANITPVSATITLGNLSQRWDGTAKAATATTTPNGLAVTLTYSQNGTPVAAPTNAGFYDVVATINNPNYQGTATAIFVILNRVDLMPGNSFNIISVSDTKTTEIVAAILGTVTFDARTVVPASVTLGDGIGADAPVNTTSAGALRASINDVNADGRADLVLYFKKATVMSTGNVTTQTTELVVRGTLTSGAPIKGTDKVTVYP